MLNGVGCFSHLRFGFQFLGFIHAEFRQLKLLNDIFKDDFMTSKELLFDLLLGFFLMLLDNRFEFFFGKLSILLSG